MFSSKRLRIKFDELDGFFRDYDGIRYLTFFDSEKHDAIYNRIRYLISQKSGITYFFSLLCKSQLQVLNTLLLKLINTSIDSII